MSAESSPKPGDIVRLDIETLGGRGDGVARLNGVPVYVPLTAPGDSADVLIGEKRGDGLAGRLMALRAAGHQRRVPPCPYFAAETGACGGCALQHVAPATYAAWKGGIVGAELARHGLGAVPVQPMRVPEGGDALALRRRVALAAHRQDGQTRIGFHARATRRIVAIDECLLLTPALNRLIGPLAGLMAGVLAEGERGQAAMTETMNGVDVLLASPRRPKPETVAALAAFAAEHRLARVSWRVYRGRFGAAVRDDDDDDSEDAGVGGTETLIQREPCRVALAGRAVDFPPGGFLQPSPWGEATLQRLVVEGAGEARRVADLFAGLGTFSFALADKAKRKVHAVEGDAGLIRALEESANRAGFSGKLTAEARNLERRPLLGPELAGFDAVVLNPPRAGARAQCAVLAEPRPDGPARLVMVSCNPATLARDARILVDGGWRFEGAAPVDQFLYSAHLEAVAVFTRRPTRRRVSERRGGRPDLRL